MSSKIVSSNNTASSGLLDALRGFYLAFPIRDALRHELSWTHYRKLPLVLAA